MRRKLGQHFLKTRFLDRLIPFLDVKEKRVIEIGVGRGNLTKKVAPLVNRLIGYEKDPYLCWIAKRELEHYTNVEIVCGDALQNEPKNFEIIIGNLPFSISSKFVEWIITNKVKRATVILQKDFVDKLMAKPGERKYVALSVLAQYFYEITPLIVIPPYWFSPPPKVYSALVDFKRKRDIKKEKEMIQKIKTLFLNKKKRIKEVLSTENIDRRIYELEPEILCEIVLKRDL